MADVIVKKSKISGQGVFTVRNFKKGEIVLKWKTDNLLTKEQVEKLSKEERQYIPCLKDNKYLLLQPPERYVNHSCNPNTNTKNYCDVAIKDIKKSEEITGDYLSEGIPTGLSKFRCNCGSQNCQGLVIEG